MTFLLSGIWKVLCKAASSPAGENV